jgi:hypothetical protein
VGSAGRGQGCGETTVTPLAVPTLPELVLLDVFELVDYALVG